MGRSDFHINAPVIIEDSRRFIREDKGYVWSLTDSIYDFLQVLLINIVSFSGTLIKNMPCYSLGFVNNKQVAGFVRGICASSNIKNSV